MGHGQSPVTCLMIADGKRGAITRTHNAVGLVRTRFDDLAPSAEATAGIACRRFDKPPSSPGDHVNLV